MTIYVRSLPFWIKFDLVGIRNLYILMISSQSDVEHKHGIDNFPNDKILFKYICNGKI